MMKVTALLLFVAAAYSQDDFSATGVTLEFKDTDGSCQFVKDGNDVQLNSACDLTVKGNSVNSLINHVNTEHASVAKLDAVYNYLHAKDCPAIVGSNHLAHVDGARTHGNGFCRYNCAPGHHDADANGDCTPCLSTCNTGYTLTGTCSTESATSCDIIANFCPASVSIDKGSVAVNSRHILATAAITCSPGEPATGTTTATCGSDGTWSIGDAMCGNSVDCLEILANGDSSGKYDFTDGSKRFCEVDAGEVWTQIEYLANDNNGKAHGFASVFSGNAMHSIDNGGSYKLSSTPSLLTTATKFRFSRAPANDFDPAQTSGWDMDVECDMTEELRSKIQNPGFQDQACAQVYCTDRLTGASFSRFANYQGWSGGWTGPRIAVGTECTAPHYHVNYCENCAVTWKHNDGVVGTYNADNIGTSVTAWWLSHADVANDSVDTACSGNDGVQRLVDSSRVFCHSASDTDWTQIEYLANDATGYMHAFASVFSDQNIGSVVPISTSGSTTERSYKVDATALLAVATKFRFSRAPANGFDPAQTSGWDMDVECDMTETLRSKIQNPGFQDQPCATVQCKDRLTGATFSRFANYQGWSGGWTGPRIAVGTECTAPHYHVNYCENCAVTWKHNDGVQGTYNADNIGTSNTAWWLGM